MGRQLIATFPSAATRANSSPYSLGNAAGASLVATALLLPGSASGAGAAPSWLGSTPVNGWVEIAGTNPNASGLPTLTPYGAGAESIIDRFNGLALDDVNLRLYGLGNGGHNNRAGNQIHRCALGNSPGWTEPFAGSAEGVIPPISPNNGGITYSDGRPRSHHSYYCHQFIRKASRAFIFGQGAVWNNGGVTEAIFAYVEGASDYENTAGNYQTWGSLSGAQISSVRSVAKHPTTEDVYYTSMLGGNPRLYRWSIAAPFGPADASHTEMAGPPVDLSFWCSAVDSTRNRIVYWRGNGDFGSTTTTVHIYDIAANSWSTATLNAPRPSTITGGGTYQGFLYSPITDRFYTRLRGASGGTTYVIHPSTFEVTALSTTGGGSIAADEDGPHNRFCYAPALAPGSSIGGIFYIPNYTSNVSFLRLH